MRTLPRLAVVLALGTAACSGSSTYAPATGQQILDDLTEAGLIDCTDVRSPVPDVLTCVDDDGDVTVALTDDGPARMATISGDGPHLAGDTWVVLTFDGDEARVDAIRDTLGDGEVYVRDQDGELLVPRDTSG